jgi:glycosyltransferase 2 family protein
MKRTLTQVLKFGFSGGIIVFLISTGRLNFDSLFLFSENPMVLLSILLGLLGFIIPAAAFRWWLLLRASSIRLSVYQAYLLTWIGNFFNITLPGAVTGDLIKGYYIVKVAECEEKTAPLMTLLIDRVVGLFGLIIMAFIALIFNWQLIFANPRIQPLALFIITLFVLILLFYTLVLFPFRKGHDPFIKLIGLLPKSRFFIKIYTAFKNYQYHWKTLAGTLVISISMQCLCAILFLQIGRMIGITDINLMTQMFIMPIGLMTMAIPLAPGGIGVGHVAFETLYLLIGVQGGADVFNLYFVIQLAVFLMGGLVYLMYDRNSKISK